MTPSGLSAVLGRIATIRDTIEPNRAGFSTLLDASGPSTSTPAPVERSPEAASPTPSRGLPAGAGRWQAAIHRAAASAGIDPELLTAVVWTESDFTPDAVSHAGAIGLAQLMPATADALGVDPFDPDQNLAGGATYLAEMLDRFGGRVDLALAAYNAGPTRVASLHDGGPGVPVSHSYVNTVLDRYHHLGGTS